MVENSTNLLLYLNERPEKVYVPKDALRSWFTDFHENCCGLMAFESKDVLASDFEEYHYPKIVSWYEMTIDEAIDVAKEHGLLDCIYLVLDKESINIIWIN